MTVDSISLQTTPILLHHGDDLKSQGTGFYFARSENDKKQVLFLVTNYHVLTGHSPTEDMEPIGDNIIFELHKSDSETGDVKQVRLPLFTKKGDPLWMKNSDFPDADLAVIPLPTVVYQECHVQCLSNNWANSNLKVRPTSEVTLVGYPYGYFDKKNRLPVYKTGNIASEPSVDFDGKPLILVDVSAFPGMSGSPVFAIAYGTYESESGGSVVGGIRKFLGIYASMQMITKNKYLEQIINKQIGIRDYESLEIGHVWKAKIIVDTIDQLDIEQYQQRVLSAM